MNSGVFLERNGILNLARIERQHQVNPLTFDEFVVDAAAYAPLKRLKDAGFVIIATTNQPGISRGYQLRYELQRMHACLKQQLPIDDIYTCPHDVTDDCSCHKPKPGMFVEAAHRWRLDMDRSFIISDKWHDAIAAHYMGCTSLLIRSPWNGPVHHDFLLPTLRQAADKILQLQSSVYALAGHF